MDQAMNSLKQDIRIVRLSEGDVRCESDHLADFEDMILQSDPMYPGIEQWISKKVLPGIRSSERAAFIGYVDGQAVISAVAKRGENAKICHLKLDPAIQNSHLGEVFFSLMGIEIRSFAQDVHFSLPESLWESKHGFFESFGFNAVSEHSNQYRLFDPELRSEASFQTMWGSILEKMPKLAELYSLGGFALNTNLLFSIRPQFAKKILNGEKTVELRRKFSPRWKGSKVSIYSSAPEMALVGEATIVEVCQGTLENIWEKYQDRIGCTRSEYLKYAGDLTTIYAIELDDVRPYRSIVSSMWVSNLLNQDLRPPQSYLTLENNRPWAQAISIAAYMHGCFAGASSLRETKSHPITKFGNDSLQSFHRQLSLKI